MGQKELTTKNNSFYIISNHHLKNNNNKKYCWDDKNTPLQATSHPHFFDLRKNISQGKGGEGGRLLDIIENGPTSLRYFSIAQRGMIWRRRKEKRNNKIE